MKPALRHRPAIGSLFLCTVLGCADPSGDRPTGTEGGGSTAADSTADGGIAGDTTAVSDESSGSTGEGDDTGISTGTEPDGVFDCATISDEPPTATVLVGPQAGRGITFDDSGYCIGVVEPHLVRATYGGAVEPFVPSLGDELDQIDILPGGDFVVARFDTGEIVRVTPDGVLSTIATDVFAYGVRTGPDGLVYTANSNAVHRIDPAGFDKQVFVDGDGFSPRVVDFSPDGSRMYIGTMKSGGTVWMVELDDALDPMGPPQVFYDGIGGWHDGIGVDVCGYVYVSDFDTLSLVRIDPDGGAAVTLQDADGSGRGDVFGHGLRWGSGIGGWKDDALYLPLPLRDDAVGELDIGVPYRDWDGEVLNRPR